MSESNAAQSDTIHPEPSRSRLSRWIPWRTLLVLLPPQLVYTFMHFLFALSMGHGMAWIRGKFGLLRMLPDAWRWRARAQRLRVVRDRDLLTASPLTLTPGIADRGWLRGLRRVLDSFYAFYWRLARPLCG